MSYIPANFAKVYSNYSAMVAASASNNTVAYTTNDGMYWVYQNSRWNPIRSRIFNSLGATKSELGIKRFIDSSVKGTKAELGVDVIVDNSINQTLDP